MSKYSLLFEPERYHKVGPFRFPIYEDLSPGEARGIEELNKKQSRNTYKSIRLSQKIAKERGIKVKEALELLGRLGEEENQDLLFKYTDEIQELSNESLSVTQQKIDYVTLFMQFRGQVKMPDSDKYVQTADWTENDTQSIRQMKVLDEIFNLVIWERDGWPTPEDKKEGNEPAPTKKTS